MRVASGPWLANQIGVRIALPGLRGLGDATDATLLFPEKRQSKGRYGRSGGGRSVNGRGLTLLYRQRPIEYLAASALVGLGPRAKLLGMPARLLRQHQQQPVARDQRRGRNHQPQVPCGIEATCHPPVSSTVGAPVSNPRRAGFPPVRQAARPRRVSDFLVAKARKELALRARKLATRIGREVAQITVRDTRSRWGSCSGRGNLSFSWRLIFAPERVIDYVGAHEVAHLAEMNHGPRFWSLVESLSPDSAIPRAWLKRHRSRLFSYG